MNIKQIRKVQEGEYIAADYMPTTEKSTDGMYEELLGYIKKVDNQYLRQVLDHYFIKDETFIRNFRDIRPRRRYITGLPEDFWNIH